MPFIIASDLLAKIHNHGVITYPEEGAGLLLGHFNGDQKYVTEIIRLENAREEGARHNRYLIPPEEMLHGEQAAIRKGLEILGVFHSHPDHPNTPSKFDRQWALPWYTYLITSVQAGEAGESRAWRLQEDCSGFFEEQIRQIPHNPITE